MCGRQATSNRCCPSAANAEAKLVGVPSSSVHSKYTTTARFSHAPPTRSANSCAWQTVNLRWTGPAQFGGFAQMRRITDVFIIPLQLSGGHFGLSAVLPVATLEHDAGTTVDDARAEFDFISCGRVDLCFSVVVKPFAPVNVVRADVRNEAVAGFHGLGTPQVWGSGSFNQSGRR